MLISEGPFEGTNEGIFISETHFSLETCEAYFITFIRTFVHSFEGILLFHAAILQGYIINIEDN